MFRTQRVMSRAGTFGVASGLAAVAVVGVSPTAHAYQDPTALRFQGHVADTRSSVLLRGDWQPTQTELMILGTRTGAPEALVYCIDLQTSLRNDVDYHEGTWGDSWLADSATVARINWVLNHSYPKVTDLTTLGRTANLPTGKKLSAEEAVAATQAAIWHYSNGAEVSKWNNEDVLGLYGYLTGDANKGQPDEPGASLELSPSTTSGKDGDAPGIGPVTVKTTSTEPVTVGLDGQVGATLVDKDGKAMTTAANGTDLFVKVSKNWQPGEAKITASTKAGVNVGRVFLGKDRKHSQTLITAGSQPFPVDASAMVQWSHQAAPVPSSKGREECVQGGVSVTLKNTGDAPADFTVDGTKVTVPADASKTHFVKVVEDGDYSIKVTGPVGYAKTHTGRLDCVVIPPVRPTTAPPSTTPPTVPPATRPNTATPSAPPTNSAPTTPPTTPHTTAASTAPPTSARPTTPPASKPATGAPSTTSAPSASASESAPPAPSTSTPEPSASPSAAPPKLIVSIVVPGTEDQPITVPWLPVVPVSDSKDLAKTGGNNSDTILFAGAAVALFATGGGALYLNKRRNRPQA
ncbi:Cys-Gln thioester bond-forming surface protein (plasmid) [Embleya sp. NBC_00888]|uniref:Cys-Gln thioester bond-forming surface protein n=1 Tax=Embleya sp. NBC_00888 TaxID=2975960 RepID=UPI002F90C118|nr:Cys-Gln thioester bond-forming surface protein [Embleya sp. NBC_00888]